MTTTIAPDLEQYWDTLDQTVPIFTAGEQRIGLTLYRELAKGQPVSVEQLAAASRIPVAEAGAFLASPSIAWLVYPDEQGRVVGFAGLSIAPMHHQFQVANRTLWTWCAWDSLFLPERLGMTAHIESADPETREVVRLDVGPSGVRAADPATAVVSFLALDPSALTMSAAHAIGTFCHFVYFFASPASGERWIAAHPGTFLYSLDEAMVLAHRFNVRTFGLPDATSGP